MPKFYSTGATLQLGSIGINSHSVQGKGDGQVMDRQRLLSLSVKLGRPTIACVESRVVEDRIGYPGTRRGMCLRQMTIGGCRILGFQGPGSFLIAAFQLFLSVVGGKEELDSLTFSPSKATTTDQPECQCAEGRSSTIRHRRSILSSTTRSPSYNQ